MIKTSKLILLILFFYLSNACSDNKIVKQKVKDMPDEFWQQDSIVSISFQPQKNQVYDISFFIRNNDKYPFSNIFLIAQIENERNSIIDTLEYEMADAEGKWLGTGFGEIKESKLIYKNKYQFKDTLPYKISVEQAVRKNGEIEGEKKLPGILSVGIIIEKADN